MLAARVLSNYYERVTILDRDTFPAAGEQRRGVPQGVHTHGLLASGREVFERLFPGLTAEMIAAGALPGDLLADSVWFIGGASLSRVKCGIGGLLLSRPFLEGMIRQRVRANPKITMVENTVVEGVVATEDRKRVTGAKTAKEVVFANLIVDATGRGSHTPQWLETLGYAQPPEERVEVALAYSTRWFRRRPDHIPGDSVVIVPATPEGKRAAAMLAQEGDRWTVTLVGYFGQNAPLDLPGFIEYAKSLPAPQIHQVISNAEPIGEGHTARFPASVRRHYEKLERFPDGFLVIGDAICSFNPIYGQGMSVAALESEALAQSLGAANGNLARDFFRRASKIVDMPWAMAVGNDLRIPETVGTRNAALGFINWYVSKLHQRAHRDPELSIAFVRAANLLAPPSSMLHPRVMARVFLGI